MASELNIGAGKSIKLKQANEDHSEKEYWSPREKFHEYHKMTPTTMDTTIEIEEERSNLFDKDVSVYCA